MSRRNKSEQRAVERERQRIADIKQLMQLPMFRRFMFDLLDRRCRLFSGSFSGDPYLTAHREGGRGVGIDVASELQRLCSGNYVEMIEEQFKEQHTDRLIEELDQTEPPADEPTGEVE
jgi:hypothetical protein